MGRGKEFWNDAKVRGDEIMWLNNNRWEIKDICPNIYDLLNKMDTLRLELNDACKLDSSQTQVSCVLRCPA
jgi:hypothetical protein